MQIVIEIPEEKYQGIINMAEEILDASTFCSPRYLYKAVLNGTPLPKGHGRLGDLDKIEKKMKYYHDDCAKTSYYTRLGFETAIAVVKKAKSIIEADKTERSDKE